MYYFVLLILYNSHVEYVYTYIIYILGTITSANGSAMVRLGETCLVCGIKAEVAEPSVTRPREGFFGMSPYIIL